MSNGKPSDGYKFGNKAQYRRTLWNYVDECLADIPVRNRSVIILETSEALESEFLVSRKRYPPTNILAINRNAAELAWMTRNLKSNGIIGVDGIRADVLDFAWICSEEELVEKFKYNEIAVIINLDLTGPLSKKTMHFLRNFTPKCRAVLAITMLRGRETDLEIRRELEGCKNIQQNVSEQAETFDIHSRKIGWDATDKSLEMTTDIYRVGILTRNTREANPQSFIDYRWDIYKSSAGNQTMLWLAMHFCSEMPESLHGRMSAFKGSRITKMRNWYLNRATNN